MSSSADGVNRTERRRLRKQRRLMAAELIGVMLDHPRAADLDPGLRAEVERMMRNPRSLDAIVDHLLRNAPAEPPAPPPGVDVTIAVELLSEWQRRLDERELGGA